MKIFLVGFMGCGKTTIGRKLASKLGWAFIDLDAAIEENTGRSIPDYFKEQGEPAFRKKESEILKGLDYPENAVVATGGGAPCYFDNMEWMKKQGVTVYISLTPASLALRLERAEGERPVLQSFKGAALVGFIAGKLSERLTYYEQADIILKGNGLTANKLWAAVDQRK